jgi:hypothetical protein
VDKNLIEDVIYCLPEGRTKYYYFKDRYALMLLSYLVGDGKSVAELKKSHYKNLLQKQQVKKLLSMKGHLDQQSLLNYWPDEIQPFVLTVDRWGGGSPQWQQTTRHGYNLVVQLNFSNAHDAIYRRLVKPVEKAMLNYCGHPVLLPGQRDVFRETLAWARLDMDFETNEVLIEEIQSDWVRKAKAMLYEAQKSCANGNSYINWRGAEGKSENIVKYVKQVLMPYIKIWDEAILSATIDFVRNELGIDTVYYHSYESGPKLKYIYGNTPRDLYTRLPKRFCFEKTSESPVFLQKDRRFKCMMKKMAVPQWYRLNLEEVNRNAYVS